MKLFALLSALLLLTRLTAPALTIAIDAAILRDQFGNEMSQTGVVVLVASTSDATFNGPFGSSLVTGDDIVLGAWDLSTYGINGVFSVFAELYFSDFADPANAGNPSANWGTNDPLRLYWYPDLALTGSGPGPLSAGMAYGTYSDSVGIDGTEAWKTPAEFGSVALGFFTDDTANLTIEGEPYPYVGTNTFEDAMASNVVPPTGASSVPDTGGTLVLLSASLAGIITIRRFRQRQAAV